ncbi:MAG: hypothetical protein EOP07_02835 [Proteobacteria bacterium]|nr:MAG: hypothetical protein EOP07_02835 [Pseudomonadota bacterium]
MKQFHKFGLVMAANFEAVAAMVAAYWSAKYLNEHYPKGFDWANLTYVLGLLLIARSWYVVLRTLIRDQKAAETASEQGETKDGSGPN